MPFEACEETKEAGVRYLARDHQGHQKGVVGRQQLLNQVGLSSYDRVLQHDNVVMLTPLNLQVLSSNNSHLLPREDWSGIDMPTAD